MNLYHNSMYLEDVEYVSNLDLPWELLRDRHLMVSGATGLLGSFLVDVLMYKNLHSELNCKIFAMGRSEQKTKMRFSKYANDENLIFVPYDAKQPIQDNDIGTVDYVLHLASNTHPLQYSTDPIGTITTNIIGLQNLLDFAIEHNVTRFAFASSNEIYGENRGDVEFFDENYCGYINSNTLRAGYPESKRCGEALCQAYIAQKGIDCVIMRFTRSYGPTMKMNDTKAINQFIKNGLLGEDIVLKSNGTQYYSYQYVADSVSGLLTVLLLGQNGEAYNIAEEHSDIMLKDLAYLIAEINGKKVVYQKPNAIESDGFSKATKARLDGHKIQALGWMPKYSIKEGIIRTISILKS